MTGWSPIAVTAVVAAASAAALLVRAPVVVVVGSAWPRRGGVAGLVALLLVVTAAAPSSFSSGVLRGRTLAIVAIAALTAYAGIVLVGRRRRRHDVAAGRARVLDFCRLLAAELAAGQPPASALERSAGEWPELSPVLAAFRLGSDVPSALRATARGAGHADLVLVAAAWQVAHGSGGGLAAAVGRVAAGIRAHQATRRVVQAELASARATARLMAGLPVLALVMGGGLGGNPVAFLLGTGPGLACLAGGLALGFLGLWWIESIADAVAREPW